MRSKFPAYYRIHKEDLLSHFSDCIFMFDACALLDIYRMKKEVTEDVFKVMEHLKDQIRIPYHVAEEYYSNIHEVLNEQIENIKNSRTGFNKFVQALEAKRSQPYISKNAANLLDKLKKQVDKDFEQQESYILEQLIHGDYQNRLADLLEGKVLNPIEETLLTEICKEGETRYEAKIPPGYKDAKKSPNRYGDLIIWKEILQYAKESKKSIIIVSSDVKDDWVIREQGKIICLRYELLKEFYDYVDNNNQLIHFLSLDRFLEIAREKDNKVISEETVNEVKDYVVLPKISNVDTIYGWSKNIAEQIEKFREIQNRLSPNIYNNIDEISRKYKQLPLDIYPDDEKTNMAELSIDKEKTDSNDEIDEKSKAEGISDKIVTDKTNK